MMPCLVPPACACIGGDRRRDHQLSEANEGGHEGNIPDWDFVCKERLRPTDIQNSLLKFFDLQDFHTRMLIVADKNRRKEFDQKMRFGAFAEIKDRVGFLEYNTLVKQYEYEALKLTQSVTV